jgi:serine/threonine protein kinase
VSKGPQWWVKIADFGISKRAVEGLTGLHTLTGTKGFTAPEVLGYGPIEEGLDVLYTNAVDIWSTGVITFLVLTSQFCFKDQRHLGQYALGSIDFPIQPLHARSISESGCDFIKTLIAATPQRRPTAKQALQHAWLINQDKTATYIPSRYFS